MYDVEVLVDLGGDELRITVALGASAEDGTRTVMTPWFPTEDGLDEFCERHIGRFQFKVVAEGLPDATEWEAV
jgi:hypothetical protein